MNTTSVQQKQNTQSSIVKLDSQGNIQWISLNPNPIQLYSSQLCDSLTERDTVVTYKQALIKTWQLLKSLLYLVFSVFLLALALLVSIWGIGYNLGGQFQKWLDNGGKGRTPEEFVTKLLKILYSPIQKVVEWANKYVEKYLPGWKPSNCKFFE